VLLSLIRQERIEGLVATFVFAFTLICAPFFSPAARSQSVTASKGAARECKAGYDDSTRKKKASAPKKKGAAADFPIFESCVEIHDTSIAIQEYLQAVVRDSRWNIGDEQASEELWSFTLYLKAEEVAAFTKPPADPKMSWSGGKGVVNVRTNELPDGFTRVIVRAKFDGFGEPEDKFAPQRISWPLPSSGVLETKLTTAARDRTSTGH